MAKSDKKVPFPSAPLDKVYVRSGYSTMQYNGQKYYGFENIPAFGWALLSAILLKKGRLDNKELRYIRNKLDYTQAELAAIIGTKEQTYMQWERGDRRISKAEDTLLRVFVSQSLKKELAPYARNLSVHAVAEINESTSELVEYIGEYEHNNWIVSAESIRITSVLEQLANALKSKTLVLPSGCVRQHAEAPQLVAQNCFSTHDWEQTYANVQL